MREDRPISRPEARSSDRHEPLDAGFTLLELLIVLVILGLLASLVAPQLFSQLGRARTQTSAVQIESLGTALDLFRLDVGRYPTTTEGLKALTERPQGVKSWRGPYVDKPERLLDSWGRSFVYQSPVKVKAYDLVSLGADGAAGGTGDNADIGN